MKAQTKRRHARIRTIHQMSRLPAILSPLSGKRSMPFAIITASCLSLATFNASATISNNLADPTSRLLHAHSADSTIDTPCISTFAPADFDRLIDAAFQWRGEDGHAPGRHCAGGGVWGWAKIWNSQIWPRLANWHLHCRQ